MTIDEAITTEIEYSQPCDIICKDGADCNDCRSYHRQLAEWLEELKQYRQIGTVEECRALKDRLVAKKVSLRHVRKFDGFDDGKCPTCGELVSRDFGGTDIFCSECGQKLDWSDKE
jgi:hypothetical protein